MCALLQYQLLFRVLRLQGQDLFNGALCKQTPCKIYTAYINTSAEGRKLLYFILEHPGPMYNACSLGPRTCYITFTVYCFSDRIRLQMLPVCICISRYGAVMKLCLRLHYIEHAQCHLQLQLADLIKRHKGYV